MKMVLIGPHPCQTAWKDYKKAKETFLDKKQKW